MAAVSDKARFYLEQQVPELQEFERKQVFSHDEVKSIVSKRSDFEHTLNARGSRPGDYARYASYEMNLDSLRKKRCKRRGVKGLMYNGPRTVFSILERATRQFPGDMNLWMQYIQFCQKEQANKKLAKAFTSVLRLHPLDWNLWVLAAKYYAEQQGDMSAARSYMQRGLRFCKTELRLYLEYIKLEMVYLAKLAARRKVLGLDEEHVDKQPDDENMITLPTITAADINPEATKGIEEVNASALERLAKAPAFTGAIPMAIFDSAMKQPQSSANWAEVMFDSIATFTAVPSTKKILQHISDRLQATDPSSVEAIFCNAKLQLFGIDFQSPDLPSALSQALVVLRSAFRQLSDKYRTRFAERAVVLLDPYVESSDVDDDDMRTAVRASLKLYTPLLPQKQDLLIEGT